MKRSYVVQTEGRLAMWTRPDATLDKMSYAIPTPGGIRGFVKCIYHKNHLEIIPTQVEVLKPVQRVNVQQWMWRASRIGDTSTGSGKPHAEPYSQLYLWDVAYRFHFDVYCEEEKALDKLGAIIEECGFYSHPCFGTRECGATLVPVDGTTPCKGVTLIEPNLVLSNNGTTAKVMVNRGVVDFTPHYDAIRQALADRRF